MPEIAEEVEDAGLRHHVQAGRGLVQYQQARRTGDADGDRNPLQLTAGQLVRIPIQQHVGLRQPDQTEQPCRSMRADALFKP